MVEKPGMTVPIVFTVNREVTENATINADFPGKWLKEVVFHLFLFFVSRMNL